MSSDAHSSRATELSRSSPPPLDPRATEVAAWVGQFSRTLKTCRLYDATNPTSIRFREELGLQMRALLESVGPVTLEFTANEVRFEGQAVLTARTREDNFAMPFYRDGLRRLTFQPGTEVTELATIVDLLLGVTGHATNGGEDLVTLLWDADLTHIDMSYVSSETDADLGEEGENATGLTVERTNDLMPWPSAPAGGGTSRSSMGAVPMPASGPDLVPHDDAAPMRSEDWLASDPVHELDACYAEIEAAWANENARFLQELRQERGTDLIERTVTMVRETLAAELLEDDRGDMVALLGRLLHENMTNAHWAGAHETLRCLAEASGGTWDSTALMDQCSHPDSVITASVVRHLDRCGVPELNEFLSFARSFGPGAAEWLMCIVAAASHQRTRRTLLRAITELCEGNPERLAPWLIDPRWYVVRNAVIVVGAASGGATAGLFRAVIAHPEPRVRQEVVTALAKCDPDSARPLLLELIRDGEPAIRSAALFQLGSRRHPDAAAALLKLVQEEGFRERPIEEVRAVTGALGGCGDNQVLPALQDQLYAPRWFSAGSAPYCQAIARCLARIGTPEAFALLEQGAQSKTPATRDACRVVLKGLNRG